MSYLEVQSSGTKVYISSSPGGAAATEIFGVDSLGDIGPQCQTQDVTTMRDTAKRQIKTALTDYGKMSWSGIRSNGDAGQQAMAAAASSTSSTPYNFKITLPDGTTTPTTFTFQGFVTSFKSNPGKPGDVVKFKAEIAVTGAITETLPT